MRYLIMVLLVSSFLCGCQTPNRAAYKTLASIALTVNTAKHSYEEYRDSDPSHYNKAVDEKLKSTYLHYQQAFKVAEDAQRSLQAGTLDKPVWEKILDAVAVSAQDIVSIVHQANPNFK